MFRRIGYRRSNVNHQNPFQFLGRPFCCYPKSCVDSAQIAAIWGSDQQYLNNHSEYRVRMRLWPGGIVSSKR